MKLLLLDVETSPALVYVWSLFGNDAIGLDQIVEPCGLLCWAAKWHGRKETYWRGANQAGGLRRCVRGIYSLLCEADAVGHYNGDSFDLPRLNAEFALLGLRPPPPIPSVDLCSEVKRKFGFTSHKLDFVSRTLKLGQKVQHAGWRLWRGCLDGDRESWRVMKRYNRQDVVLLEKLYDELLPWLDRHPNLNLISDSSVPVCPSCASANLERRGTARSITRTYDRFVCRACGRWSRAVRSRTRLAATVR